MNKEEPLCNKCGCPLHPNMPCNEVVALGGNATDTEYFRLLDLVFEEGRLKKNRTGVDTLSVFGAQAKYDINLNAFPILTTKKVHFKSIVHELLWFISGSTNIKYLVDNDVHIWDEWAYARYKKTPINNLRKYECKGSAEQGVELHFTQNEFIDWIKREPSFAQKWGELGEGTYGSMWRAFPYHYTTNESKVDVTAKGFPRIPQVSYVDQIQNVIDALKNNPDDRRLIVSAWHPYWSQKCALAPCHCMFQFHTEELTKEERRKLLHTKLGITDGRHRCAEVPLHTLCDQMDIPRRRLNCMMTQRSNDLGLGVPFNFTSYSLLTAMIAHCVNMAPGTFTHSMGDLHIYVNHVDGLKKQLTRTPMKLPLLWLNPKVKSLFDFKYDDIKLVDYNSHPAIKLVVAV